MKSMNELLVVLATVLAAGWFSAFVTQALKRVAWPGSLKLVLSGLVALAVAIATLYLSGEVTTFISLYKTGALTAEYIVVFFTLVFTSASAWYKLNFKGSTWAESLAAWPNKAE